MSRGSGRLADTAYQHDVDEKQLSNALNGVVEDAVNAVGVEVNTASIPLLQRVSGLNETLARNIVHYRDTVGPFKNRKNLNKVPRFGPKTFEQAAGFLRIRNGDTPLDGSAVHPESYPVVKRILEKTGTTLDKLIGDHRLIGSLTPSAFTDSQFGEPTVRDILAELEKPGRDPRPEFKTASFRDGIESLTDLEPGMILEGVVSNVTNFGAFVDIGVHQDGLVHISAMANRFVKDPHTITKAGAVVTVRVMSVDVARKRVGLSMRLDDKVDQKKRPAPSTQQKRVSQSKQQRPERKTAQTENGGINSAMAAAFAQATKKKR
ncbi:MAG: helix-hairpin-helix domain-containing protein [Magnetococcales bacterium]|nr:helix-hairpin-helix domain-containing protein [Magnetococcales bacterium]